MAGRPYAGDDWHAENATACEGTADGPDGAPRARAEVAVARTALSAGDLRHAAHHVADAMHIDPRLPEAHETLTRLAARAGGPDNALDLFPTQHPYVGAMACRAHLLAALGRWDDAVKLLAKVVAAEPDPPWAHAAWISRPDLPALVGVDAVYRAVASLASGLKEPLSPEAQEPVQPFYTLVREVVARHRDEPELLAIASGLARRFADVDDAVEWGAHAHRLAPGYLTSVMLGYALRAAGDPDAAITVWSAQLGRDPSDLMLHVDIAELYAATGRPAQGLPWVERVLALEPAHEKAAPAALGIRYAMDGDAAHLVALVDHLREHPEHGYAATVLSVHCAGKPWLGRVHYASEATVNVLHQVLESRRPKSGPTGDGTGAAPDGANGDGSGAGADGGTGDAADGGASDPAGGLAAEFEGDVSVSMIEPPSAVLAVRTAIPRVRIAFQSVGDPDPRLPAPDFVEAGLQVWRYTDLDAEAAVPPPSVRAADRARATAELNWPNLPAAYDHAVALSDLPMEDLVGLLVHPPRPREDEQGRFLAARVPDLWIRAVQTFACLGIAHHRADEPWPRSARRRALLDLLAGPEDWVCEAAATALVAVAWTQPETRDEVGRAIAARMLSAAQAYQTRPVTILESLCLLTLACPWLEQPIADLARELVKTLTPPEIGRGSGGAGR